VYAVPIIVEPERCITNAPSLCQRGSSSTRKRFAARRVRLSVDAVLHDFQRAKYPVDSGFMKFERSAPHPSQVSHEVMSIPPLGQAKAGELRGCIGTREWSE